MAGHFFKTLLLFILLIALGLLGVYWAGNYMEKSQQKRDCKVAKTC